MTSEKKRVHLIHLSSRPGGIEVLMPLLIHEMPDWNFQSFVIRKHASDEPNVYDLIITSVEYGSNKNFRVGPKIFLYALKNRKNIFQVFNIGPFFLLAFRLAGVKNLIYSIHGTIYWNTKRQRILRKLFWRLALSKNYIITSNSEYSKQVFLDKINSKCQIQVLYNPINYKRFSPAELTEENRNLKIIYVGRLSKGKNLESWIDIAYKIHNSLPDTQFEIYGSGPSYESLLSKVVLLNAENYVQLKGFRDDVEDVYRQADLLLFLSKYESFGNVVVECILCGTPVLAADIPSMKEIFKDFPEFIVRSDADLFQTVYRNLLDIKTLKARTLKARESFKRRFSTEVHTNTLNKLYHSFNV